MTEPHLQNQETTQPKSKLAKKFGYIVSICVNVILLFVVQKILDWDIVFITNAWGDVVGIFTTSLMVTICVYASFILYDGKLFYVLGRTICDLIGIAVLYRLFTIFPFDFTKLFSFSWLNSIFPYILLLGIVGILVGIIVRLGRLMANKNIYY